MDRRKLRKQRHKKLGNGKGKKAVYKRQVHRHCRKKKRCYIGMVIRIRINRDYCICVCAIVVRKRSWIMNLTISMLYG